MRKTLINRAGGNPFYRQDVKQVLLAFLQTPKPHRLLLASHYKRAADKRAKDKLWENDFITGELGEFDAEAAIQKVIKGLGNELI